MSRTELSTRWERELEHAESRGSRFASRFLDAYGGQQRIAFPRLDTSDRARHNLRRMANLTTYLSILALYEHIGECIDDLSQKLLEGDSSPAKQLSASATELAQAAADLQKPTKDGGAPAITVVPDMDDVAKKAARELANTVMAMMSGRKTTAEMQLWLCSSMPERIAVETRKVRQGK